MRSMTGFGDAEREVPGGRLRVELRTVNHRFLNPQIRTPRGFDRMHPALERKLREFFARGHVSVTVTLEGDDASDDSAPPRFQVDMARARAWRDALHEARDELGLTGVIEVRDLLNLSGLFVDDGRDEERTPWIPEVEEVEAVIVQAAHAALEMRRAEGMRLAAEFEERLTVMEDVVRRIEASAPDRLERERDRIHAQIERLLPDGVPVDEERIAREIAHLAERWDIREEIVRFRSHLEMFRDALGGGGEEGIGKRLGFVVQEILREANTVGSKANDAGIARDVVSLKEEIERIREQLENVE